MYVILRDNVHSHLCHAKRPMAVSFLTPTPSSKRPFQSGKIFQHFEGPFFEVQSIGLALCQYVTGAGFPDLGLVNCSSMTEESIGKSKMKLTWNICVIKLLKGKQFVNIPSTR